MKFDNELIFLVCFSLATMAANVLMVWTGSCVNAHPVSQAQTAESTSTNVHHPRAVRGPHVLTGLRTTSACAHREERDPPVNKVNAMSKIINIMYIKSSTCK